MAVISNPTLQAIVDAAAEATAATHGWLLAVRNDDLVATAVTRSRADHAQDHGVRAGEGSAGYVLASGQPLALQVRPGDASPWSREHPLLGRVAETILSVPCEAGGELVGVLELLDKASGSFSFDDVEVVTLLGGIAGAALTDHGALPGRTVTHPDALGRELAQVFVDDPSRYVRIAVVLQALLSDG